MKNDLENELNKKDKCVSRTDTNPPFAFQIAFPRGTYFTGFLPGPPGIPVREFPGIPVREFPGILRKLRSVIFFPVISLFVQFHYHLQQLLSVNYNVLSIKLPTVKLKKQKQAYMYKKRELT